MGPECFFLPAKFSFHWHALHWKVVTSCEHSFHSDVRHTGFLTNVICLFKQNSTLFESTAHWSLYYSEPYLKPHIRTCLGIAMSIVTIPAPLQICHKHCHTYPLAISFLVRLQVLLYLQPMLFFIYIIYELTLFLYLYLSTSACSPFPVTSIS